MDETVLDSFKRIKTESGSGRCISDLLSTFFIDETIAIEQVA
jgi:hypothetical protein